MKKPGQRWCIFTSAGDHNAIRLWLKDNTPRRWDLVAAYYGDDNEEFSEIARASSYAFRAKGGKWQILKKFVAQNPQFFDQYSHIWASDDDIKMSPTQIDQAFAITEFFEFWIAQPAFSPRGKISMKSQVMRGHIATTGSSIILRTQLRSFVGTNYFNF